MLKQGRDYKTHDGRHAKYQSYSDQYWPAPFCFCVNGVEAWYSIGGFINNHNMNEHDPMDLIAPWEPTNGLNEMEDKSLSELITEKRKLKGTGLRPNAKEIGISPTTLLKIEQGYKPDPKTLAKICAWLKVKQVFVPIAKTKGNEK